MFPVLILFSALFLRLFATAQYTATYLPSNAPNQTEEGQSGYNQCGTDSSQTSQCQNAYREQFSFYSFSHATFDDCFLLFPQ